MKTLKISVVSPNGEVKAEQAVSSQVFGVEASAALIGQAVKRFMANQRKALAKTKTRAEVNGSKSKIWAQKGTGRARHGDRQAPIFVGGGVAHGPKGTQNYKQKLNRKMIQKVLSALLSDKLKEKKLFLLEDTEFKKTKEAFSFLKKIQEKISKNEKISFLLSKEANLTRAFGNLDEVSLLGVESLDPYSLLKTDYVFLTKKALEKLEKNVNKP